METTPSRPWTPPLPLRYTSPPDFTTCDRLFSRNLNPQDCFIAANNHLPEGSIPITFSTSPSSSAYYQLPLVVRNRHCQISVEAAGPSLPVSIQLIPNDLRNVARGVVRECVIGLGYIGGYSTIGIRGLVTYTLDPWSDLIPPYPTNTAFVTVSVTNVRRIMLSPGRYDPSIALGLADAARTQGQAASEGSTTKEFCQNNVQLWEAHAALMKRGGDRTPWWYTFDSSMDEMTYECDAHLGNPLDNDCSQIELNQPNTPSKTLEISSNEVQFLYSGTCSVAISAAISITISWVQIQAALSTLRNFCLTRPSQPAQGGRAYHRSQGMMNKRAGKRQSQVNGLNALPPHVNVTLFRQTEPWISQTAEASSCTWKEITEGGNVDACGHA